MAPSACSGTAPNAGDVKGRGGGHGGSGARVRVLEGREPGRGERGEGSVGSSTYPPGGARSEARRGGHGDGMGAAAQGIPCGDREEDTFTENPLLSLKVIANRSSQHLSEFN